MTMFHDTLSWGLTLKKNYYSGNGATKDVVYFVICTQNIWMFLEVIYDGPKYVILDRNEHKVLYNKSDSIYKI